MMTENARIAQKWLMKTFAEDKQLKTLKLRLYKLETEINGVVKPMEKSEIQNARHGNPQEMKLAEYADLKNEIEQRTAALAETDKKTMNVIKLVPEAIERLVLIERYIYRKDWRHVCKNIVFSKSSAFRFHESALDSIYNYIPKGDLLEITDNDN